MSGQKAKRTLPTSGCQPRRTHLRPRGRSQGSQTFVSDAEHNVWNELVIVLSHHECSSWLQRCLRDGELRKVALSSHFALDPLTFVEMQVAGVRRRSGQDRRKGKVRMR